MASEDNVCHELKRPKLSDDLFRLEITLVSNPYNFYFQLFEQGKELEILMRKMQVYYNAANLPPLRKESVVKGIICAGKYTDGNWYRLSIHNDPLPDSAVAVRFCDFGDILFVELSNLRELETDFRSLPFTTMKGKLSGVSPVHTDWSNEDSFKFRKLTEELNIAGKVISIEQPPMANPIDIVVELDLVNINTNKRIADMLVEEKRAVKK